MKPVNLEAFLDTQSLTKVDKSFFLRKKRKIAQESKTPDEWSKILSFPVVKVTESVATPVVESKVASEIK